MVAVYRLRVRGRIRGVGTLWSPFVTQPKYMTNTQDKLRSLSLTVLMIVSVFAGTVIVAGPAAAANVQNIAVDAADVQGDASSTTQTVSIEVVDAGDTSPTTLTLDYGAASAVNPSVSDVRISGSPSSGSLSVSASDDTPSNDEVEIDITDTTTDGSQETYTVEVDITHDTSGVSSGGPFTYDVTASASGVTASDDFNIVEERLVTDGDSLFQGEGSYILTSADLDPATFERSAGSEEGVPLEEPIPVDHPTGSYDDGSGTSVTVQTPRVRDLEILNTNGEDIAGGTISTSASTADVEADFNFEGSEAAEITVEDESGLDVTDEAVTTSQTDSTDPAQFTLDLNNLESAEEYTVTVAGTDDLDTGGATEDATFTISSQEDASIELGQDEVTQGENVDFDLAGADEGDIHPVVIDSNDVRDGGTVANVFRNVGDTVDTGVGPNGDAVALVEFSPGAGQIETGELTDGSVDVALYEAAGTDDVSTLGTGAVDANSELDDQTLTVNEGSITLNNPTSNYVVGSEVTVNGTTSPGVDSVVIYARDEGQYRKITQVGVDGDDTFELEDFALSSDGVSNTLSLAGNYRIATLDAESDDLDDDGDGVPDDAVSSSQVSASVGTQTSLRVVDQALSVDYVSIIDGEVATGDEITVEGVALGQDEVSVSFYGPRGTYDRTEISVDSDGGFDEENIRVGGNLNNQITPDTELSQGTVVMTVFSDGRDGQVGDGSLTETEFLDLIEDLNQGSNTQSQVISQIESETTGDTGSDDLSQTFQFGLTEPRTSVDTITTNETNNRVVVAGSEMTVAGQTNRQPDDVDITVEVTEGPSTAEFDIASTDQWGTDGRWNVTLDTSGAVPGNYTVEADDGRNSDILTFQVINESAIEPEETASVRFNDQETEGDSVVVESTSLPDGGFVTIHDSTLADGEAIGSVRGTSEYLEPGTSANVEVSLDDPVEESGSFSAMPHRDTDGDETYDFVSSEGADDAPYTNANGAIVLDSAQLTLPSTPTPTATDTPEPDTPTATDEPTDTETTSGGQPGFGLAVSLIALIGAALIALRRRD